MGKVQTYRNLASYFGKAESFLLENEFKNNLFWEVMRMIRRKGGNTWAGNVFLNGKISMSGLIIPSGFLMLSDGAKEASVRLANYGRGQKWKIKGVTGPDKSVLEFSREWREGMDEESSEKKEFTIYSVSCREFMKRAKPTSLKVVKTSSWPRVQTWTRIFANESNPPLDTNTLLSVSREMMLRGTLFILKKEGIGSCAMGGFGRSTPNCLVINEVFVPKNLRGMGYGEELISGLVEQARERGFTHCILFSDFVGRQNLYDRIGFEKVVKYSELTFK
jgi:predicted GNAT family acetyltransferase